MPCPEPAIGLLGGTFDPIHYGHLRLAEEARSHFELDQVSLMPAGQPPHRDRPSRTPAQRLQMVKLAIHNNPALIVDEHEALSSTPSYTILSLQRLRTQYGPQRPLLLIVGADAFAGLDRWHRWEKVLDYCHLAVATRPGYPSLSNGLPSTLSPQLAEVANAHLSSNPAALRVRPAGLIQPFQITALDISATRIRDLFRARASVRYLLPDSVVDYIDAEQLYRP